MPEWTIEPGEAGGRLDVFLASRMPGLSRSRLKELVEQGHAVVDGRVVKPRHLLKAGEEVALTVPEAAPADILPQDIALSVLYEDEDLLVLDKAPGMVVHPGAGNGDGTLVNALLHHCQGRLSGIGGVERPGIVHRLDKETSGCLVVAKTDAAHRELSRQFADRETRKTYLAVVEGRPATEAGRIEARLGRHPVDRQRMAVLEAPRGREAMTLWRLLAEREGSSLVACRILTGRTHQIRVHLKECLRCPIAGDALYGKKGGRGAARLMLHAWQLGFTHPVSGEEMSFRSPIPPEFHPWTSRVAGLEALAGENGWEFPLP